MWLTLQEVILTKDNLQKQNWKGSDSCAFCTDKESVNHLFFECPTAKFVWSLIAYALGANCRPSIFYQYWVWIKNSLPNGKSMYAVGLVAICWAIWRVRNTVCFEKKRVKSPSEIVCMMCSFFTYWAGLQQVEME